MLAVKARDSRIPITRELLCGEPRIPTYYDIMGEDPIIDPNTDELFMTPTPTRTPRSSRAVGSPAPGQLPVTSREVFGEPEPAQVAASDGNHAEDGHGEDGFSNGDEDYCDAYEEYSYCEEEYTLGEEEYNDGDGEEAYYEEYSDADEDYSYDEEDYINGDADYSSSETGGQELNGTSGSNSLTKNSGDNSVNSEGSFTLDEESIHVDDDSNLDDDVDQPHPVNIVRNNDVIIRIESSSDESVNSGNESLEHYPESSEEEFEHHELASQRYLLF